MMNLKAYILTYVLLGTILDCPIALMSAHRMQLLVIWGSQLQWKIIFVWVILLNPFLHLRALSKMKPFQKMNFSSLKVLKTEQETISISTVTLITILVPATAKTVIAQVIKIESVRIISTKISSVQSWKWPWMGLILIFSHRPSCC